MEMPSGPESRLDWSVRFQSAELTVVQTRWDPHRHVAASKIRPEEAALEFMRVGGYQATVGSTRFIGDCNSVCRFNPGDEYSLDHRIAVINAGITIRVRGETRDRVQDRRRLDRLPVRPPFPQPQIERTAQVEILLARLCRCLNQTADCADLAVHEAAIALLAESCSPAGALSASNAARTRVAAAREYLAADPTGAHCLDSVSRAVGCSPWTLCREFRCCTGNSLQRHLRRLRLAAAVRMITEGAEDLTHVALRCGFCSHSHLTLWFRREFGVPPSAAREAFRAGRRDRHNAQPWNLPLSATSKRSPSTPT